MKTQSRGEEWTVIPRRNKSIIISCSVATGNATYEIHGDYYGEMTALVASHNATMRQPEPRKEAK